MSHLAEKITANEKRAIESAVLNHYGEITIAGDVGKQCAANYNKKYYTEGISTDADFNNVPTLEVVNNQDVYFVLWTTMTGFTLTRDSLKEYDSKVVGDTIVLTHKASQVK
ncbi:hypothetical protein [Eubacterium oxidoreducens]|uniref:Uncharacterized protein n=1 Tax=Eubacterium oxidoreducens TaxID=1732 RepID=A0A1G6B6T8_EUBOX|nr:hypothetical protein [Eubacterium oxidoreducens]SDB16360.1 hypothetical protein SAMN02910417_01247 [Eubacterium oxidoreducens]